MRAMAVSLATFLAIGLLLITVSADKNREDFVAVPEGLLYPDAEHLTTGHGAKAYQTVMATADDFGQVLRFYEKATGETMRQNCLHGGTDGATVTLDDSKQPYDEQQEMRPPRPLTMRVLVREMKDDYLTLVISRASEEDCTHIVVTRIEKS